MVSGFSLDELIDLPDQPFSIHHMTSSLFEESIRLHGLLPKKDLENTRPKTHLDKNEYWIPREIVDQAFEETRPNDLPSRLSSVYFYAHPLQLTIMHASIASAAEDFIYDLLVSSTASSETNVFDATLALNAMRYCARMREQGYIDEGWLKSQLRPFSEMYWNGRIRFSDLNNYYGSARQADGTAIRQRLPLAPPNLPLNFGTPEVLIGGPIPNDRIIVRNIRQYIPPILRLVVSYYGNNAQKQRLIDCKR